jgi:myo-inositol-1(or 4)-monophosphatase
MDDVLDIVRAAGRLVERTAASGYAVATKARGDPVTDADRGVDALLHARLRRLAPDAGWLSEETADTVERQGRERVWIVDPLDGTREFAAGLPEYAVAVALVERGAPILAVVHHPATGDCYWASARGGAFRNGDPIRVREGPLMLASRTELAAGEFAPFLEEWEVRPLGSIQLKLAKVAAGEAAVTVSRGPKHEWDVCAGALIVQEAGGHATDVRGNPLRFNQPRPKTHGVLAGAPRAYARVLERLQVVGVAARMHELGEP